MIIARIIAWSVRSRWAVVALTLLAAGWGAWSFIGLPIDAVPDITNVQVQVNATSQGLSPEDLEIKVTYPLEIAMGGIPGVQSVRSLTKFGLSQVTVIFRDDTDLYRDRQLVLERMQNLPPLPVGVETPKLSPITTGLGEIFHYTIELPGPSDAPENMMRARDIQEWVIRPRILSVPGVAEVNTIGGLMWQVQVQPDLRKLAAYRLSFADLRNALQATNRNAGGSYIQEAGRQLLVQARGQFQSLDEIRALPVSSLQNFKTVRLGDLAEVRFAGATRTGAALVNGREAVLGTVMMISGANSRTVASAVAKRIREINAGHELPDGAKIVPLYDRSDLVNATLHTVLHNLIVGAILVILVLFVLLGNIKAALVVSLSIPVTLLTTFGFMRLFGISGSLMSLGAMDFGIIVDGAVIVVDHCVRWIQDRARKQGVREKVTRASQEIRHAAGFGQIMVIVVFLPILGLGGVEGKMFRPMAATFSIALAISLLLSFTLIPALAAIFFTENESDRQPWLMRKIQAAYGPILRVSLRHRGKVLVAAAGLLLVSGFLFSRFGAEFLPRLDEGSLVLQMVRPVSISIDASVREQAASEREVLKSGVAETVFSRIGTAEVATDPMGPNESDTFVNLKPRSAWSRFPRKEAMIESVMKAINRSVPDQELSATQPIQMRFNDLLEGTRADLTVKIYGEDLNAITRVSKEIASAVRSIPGSGDVLPEFRGAVPLLEVLPRLDVLSRFSLSAAPVLDAVSIGMAGETAGNYYEGVRRIPLVVRLSESVRNRPEDLSRIRVSTGEALTVPLGQVATFDRRSVMSPVLRESSRRRTAVLINPRGKDVQTLVQEAQGKIAKAVRLPPGIQTEWFGTFRNLQEAKRRLMVLGPLALLLVALMIFWAFRSFGETALVLSTVPLALVGGVFSLSVAGIPFSISAGVGFIALSGIAVLNGVVLVHYFNELRAKAEFAGARWIIEGARMRLRPVLMTALVDIFGFTPMALSTGVGAEVQKPLATVVIGGVISSTLLTLVVLPVATSFYAGVQRKDLNP